MNKSSSNFKKQCENQQYEANPLHSTSTLAQKYVNPQNPTKLQTEGE